MADTPFAALANLGTALEGTSKRSELTALVAAFLLALDPREIAVATRMIIGRVFAESDPHALSTSWAALMSAVEKLVEASPEVREQLSRQAVDGGEYVQALFVLARREAPQPPALTIAGVHQSLQSIAETSGPGSRSRRDALLLDLLSRASPVEAKYLTKLLVQEMRQGVSEGTLLEAVAQAARLPAAAVRRANQYLGDVGELARIALAEGSGGLAEIGVEVFRPVKPMLAQSAADLDDAFEQLGGDLALEYKLDGARVQVHRRGDTVRIFSRGLEDVTASLPDVAEQVRERLQAHEAILDGEVIAVDAAGRPLPFQHVMRRFGRKREVADTAAEIPVQLFLFDMLYADGRSLVDLPACERWSALEQAAGGLHLVRRLVPGGLEEGRAFAEQARVDGHEGVMAKEPASPYTPGVRGKSWFKVKHVTSLDLVVVAADWGYGRRHGWLSNYHLAARDEESGAFVVVGKTFKGLTDVEIQAMTTRLLGLQLARRRGTVDVRPEVVVEVLFNELQESIQYPGGVALRFARISRIRDDKTAETADTIQQVRTLFERQFEHKGRAES